MANEKMVAQAQTLGFGGGFLEGLLQRFGPVLTQLLLDLLARRSQLGVMAAGNQHAQTAFDIGGLLTSVVDRFGNALINGVVSQLDARGDALSKFLATVVRAGAQDLLKSIKDMLHSPEGQAALVTVLQSEPATA